MSIVGMHKTITGQICHDTIILLILSEVKEPWDVSGAEKHFRHIMSFHVLFHGQIRADDDERCRGCTF